MSSYGIKGLALAVEFILGITLQHQKQTAMRVGSWFLATLLQPGASDNFVSCFLFMLHGSFGTSRKWGTSREVSSLGCNIRFHHLFII